jgi:hypothetical protein
VIAAGQHGIGQTGLITTPVKPLQGIIFIM